MTLALILLILPFTTACGTSGRYIYDSKADEYVYVGKRPRLKAGRQQTISLEYYGQMSEVVGKLNGQMIPFRCKSPNGDHQVWEANFAVPKYRDIGPEKFVRVYGKDLAGNDIIGGNLDRFPGAWARRGPDGEFPKISVDNFDRIDIAE